MHAEGMLLVREIEILFQSIFLGDINTQRFTLGSIDFLFQRKKFFLNSTILPCKIFQEKIRVPCRLPCKINVIELRFTHSGGVVQISLVVKPQVTLIQKICMLKVCFNEVAFRYSFREKDFNDIACIPMRFVEITGIRR